MPREKPDMVQQHATPWDLPTLLRDVPGRKDFARPLAPLTSIRIGGPADALVRIETVSALRCLQAVAREHAIPLFILGGGSNLLIRDGGIRGIVVLLRGAFRAYCVEPCGLRCTAGTGACAGWGWLSVVTPGAATGPARVEWSRIRLWHSGHAGGRDGDECGHAPGRYESGPGAGPGAAQ